MNINAKLSTLTKLDEKQLREQVLVPLLNRMGMKGVTLYHGPQERGKDVIALDFDRLGGREYLAVVAKAADLKGSVSSSDGLREVLHQIEQCFDVPYEDLFGMTKITMDRVWVVTSGKIVSGAANSIFGTLEKRNLSKLVRFIPGENLASLIDQHFPSYWEDSMEPVESLKEQHNRLSSFVRQLLISLGANKPDADSTISQVIHSPFPPPVSTSPDRSISRVSPYRVEVDVISSKYSHDFYTGQCGFVRDEHFKAKEAIFHAMFDVDEIIDHYNDVMAETDPKALVESFNKNLSEDYPFWRASTGKASDALRAMQYLEDGLRDVDDLLERLARAGKLEWACALVDSVGELEKEIDEFLGEVDKDDFSLNWRINDLGQVAKLALVHDDISNPSAKTLKTSHKKEIEFYRYREMKTRRITARDVMEEAQIVIREHLDMILAEAGFPKED